MQVWTNIWRKRDASQFDSNPYYSNTFASYDEAMEDLAETGEQFSLPAIRCSQTTGKTESCQQLYDYVCTQFSQLVDGVITEVKTYTDLPNEIKRWEDEREEDARAYRSAATLSTSQLCYM